MLTIAIVGPQWSGRSIITDCLEDAYGFKVVQFPDILGATPINFIEGGTQRLAITEVYTPSEVNNLKSRFNASTLGVRTSFPTRLEILKNNELPWLGMPETREDLVKFDMRHGVTEKGVPIVYYALKQVDSFVVGDVGAELMLRNIEKIVERIEGGGGGVERR